MPDKFSYYLANGQLNGPEIYKSLCDAVEQYYSGEIDVNQIAEMFRVKLGHPDVSANSFTVSEANIYPEIVNFIRSLHSHFLKIGILANLGTQERDLLTTFNEHNQLFEVIASPLTLGIRSPLLSQEVFARALQAIGEPPTSCLVISGNPDYLTAAANFGIATLQYEGLHILEESVGKLLANDVP